MSDVVFSWTRSSPFSLRVDDFSVARGESILLIGPSGSGKSTLLSLVCGVAVPGAGRIEVLGTDLARLSGAARDRFRADHFGIIFQMFNLLPYGDVLENVLLPLSFSEVRRRRVAADGPAETQARRLLDRLQLDGEGVDRQRAAALSVGQQQRVAAARALIGAPEIVLADEPTSALDSDRQFAFLDLLFEQVSLAGVTLVMVSHDPRLAPRFDRVVPLSDIARTARDAA